MIGWAVGEARRRDCSLVQLTTNKSRIDAHRFYERLGFVASHEGLKLELRAGGCPSCLREHGPVCPAGAAGLWTPRLPA